MSRLSRFLTLASVLLFSLASSALALADSFYDPPGRVARVSDSRGDISYSPAGEGEWYEVHRNRPLVRGDMLWSDRNSRAEVQVGNTVVRLNSETSLEFLELSDRLLQVQVSEGSINVRARRLNPGQRIEVATPNIAFVIDRPGRYRIDVDPSGEATTIEAPQGGGIAYGAGGRFSVRAGDVVRFYGEDVNDYEMYAMPMPDGFDRYCRSRDHRLDTSVSLRYLSDEVIGYSDLDNYGRWGRNPRYGNVWYPGNVSADWSPYSDGEWIWQDPWGWTWVDDEPWGFAPSHYGRWAWMEGRWGWVPGPRNYRPVYAPALVVFFGGGNNSSIGWFPLGPSEVYMPSYPVSQNYFNQINISSTVVNRTSINNVYNSYARGDNARPQKGGNYVNRRIPNSVTVVPPSAFVNSRPVKAAEVSATPDALTGGDTIRVAPVRPGAASFRGTARAARVRPPRESFDRQVFVRNAPPPIAAPPVAAAPAAQPPGTQSLAPVAGRPLRERPRRVRMISEQAGAVDARASAPQTAAPVAPQAGSAPAVGPGKLQTLDRNAEPRKPRRGARFPSRDGEAGSAQPPPAAAALPVAPPPAPASNAGPTPEQRQAERQQRQAQREAEQLARQATVQARQAREAQQATQAQQDANAARQAEEARAAQETARVEQQQAREAQQAALEAQRQAQAQQESQQAQEKANAAQRESARQQREAQQAQREAQVQAQQAATAQEEASNAAASPATPRAPRDRNGLRTDCATPERIEAMRKRGVSEERIATLTPCPVEPAPPVAAPPVSEDGQ